MCLILIILNEERVCEVTSETFCFSLMSKYAEDAMETNLK